MASINKISTPKQYLSISLNESPKELNDNDDIYIIDKSGNKNVVIFDKKDNKVLGFVTLEKVGNSEYQIKFSAAEDGYGPRLYDYSMMAVYPAKIVPSRWSVSKDAQHVWDFYYNKRSDIKKTKMDKSDKNYVDDYPDYMNYYYSMEPNSEYRKIINRSKPELSNDTLYMRGKKYFNSVYTV